MLDNREECGNKVFVWIEKEMKLNDYTKTYDNVKNVLEQFAAANLEIDIDVITPKAEYMEKFLEMYKSRKK